MKNKMLFRRFFTFVIIISAGFIFVGLGCEHGKKEVAPELSTEEGEAVTEGEKPEEAEVTAADKFGEQVVYVKKGGTGVGTKEDPMGDIQQAIDHAKAIWSTASTVVVANGIYEVDSSNATQIKMAPNVSLYGGFSSDWMKRDPFFYVTTIKDTSSSGGSSSDPNRAIQAGSGVTVATVLDGFNILGGSGTGSAAIFTNGGAALTISNNAIHGGSGSIGSLGIVNDGSSPTLFNNTINGGNSTETFGISNKNGSPKIFNNTINGGKGDTSCAAIWNWANTSPTINNNIIFSSSNTKGYGIFEMYADSDPQEVKNNDFVNCPEAFYYDHDSLPPKEKTTIGDVNAVTGAKDNVDDDPKFVSTDDWHLQGTSPTTVTKGGLDGAALGWGFSTDKDGKTRVGNGTTGWSMGAYEFE